VNLLEIQIDRPEQGLTGEETKLGGKQLEVSDAIGDFLALD